MTLPARCVCGHTPGAPPQNTGVIPDEWALAYIEEMAEIEAQSQSAPADGEQP